jgi:hypothetical protein
MEIKDLITPNMLVCDGFDDCVIGVSYRAGMEPVLAYSIEKVISKLVERDGMTHEEAVEYFDYNICSSWLGEGTPAFISSTLLQDSDESDSTELLTLEHES